MSVRLLTVRLIKHGRCLLQNYWKREIHNNILEQKQTQRQQRSTFLNGQKNVAKQVTSSTSNIATGQLTANLTRSPPTFFRIGKHARRLFVDNILNRVTTTYSAELRNQATKKLFYGDSAPFFALVGVSLASGAGVLTKEDELEGVCWEIRNAALRLQHLWSTSENLQDNLDDSFRVDKLSIGPVIAKGCAAVVYAARMNQSLDQSFNYNANITESNSVNIARKVSTTNITPEYMPPLHNMSRFVHNFGSSTDNLQLFSQRATSIEETLKSANLDVTIEQEKQEEDSPKINVNESINVSSTSSLKRYKDVRTNENESTSSFNDLEQYPLALKMMFNYDIQSNALAILKAMYKETIPARQRFLNTETETLLGQHIPQQILLPCHPNIVCMYGYFCDEVGNFPDGGNVYPSAQPQRINPEGYGRNMSLYLLMKRYDMSLREYLDKYSEQLTLRNKLLLFTQLLEGVAHINRHGIAHRDIKTDNILLEYMDDTIIAPQLVLSDFGCCLADSYYGLQIPYNHHDIDKGGNAALMAPEIFNKQPGPFAVLNYEKADLWSCGAIAYEIFGFPNPFYHRGYYLRSNDNCINNELKPLHSASYKEDDLPPLSTSESTSECPKLIQKLVYNILSRSPSKRVSPDVAANVMQLYLWAPSQWLKPGQMPNSTEILQWLLSLTTKIMCEGRYHSFGSATPSAVFLSSSPSQRSASLANSLLNYQQNGRRTYVEYILICSFLARAHLRHIRCALKWIQNVL